MSVRLEKILEAMENFKLNSDVALLENESLTPLVIAQSKKVLHESLGFIKNELTKGGVLEETQNLLRDTWTQAILEDIHVADYVPGMEDEGMGAGEMVGMGAGAAGLAAAGKYGIPAAQNGYRVATSGGAGAVGGMKTGIETAKALVRNDVNAAKAAAANAKDAVVNNPYVANPGLAAANIKADAEQAVRMAAADAARKATSIKNNQVGAATAGYLGVQGPVKPGTGAAYAVGSLAGKVRRVFK